MTRPLTFIERVVSKAYAVVLMDQRANRAMLCNDPKEQEYIKCRDVALTELEHIFREKICQE